MPEEVKIVSQETQHESMPDSELTPEAKDETNAEVTGSVAQEKVNVDDEFILLVPKGQAVEVDIEFSQTSEKSTSDTVALSEPDSTCEAIIAPEPTAVCQETFQAPNEETTAETHLEVKPEVVDIETLPRNELDAKYSPPAPAEEHPIESEPTTVCTETLQAPNEETTAEPQLEVEPEVAQQEEALPQNELDTRSSPPAPETTTTCPETIQAPNEETMIEPQLEVEPEVAEIKHYPERS
ncbi:hypothetical protein KUDE01_008041 [Dissostichus eleginoides]|uniref:Uncharacterized protein n=1 Tax=Dissostichus eleginoides TaxID=100907 RepID=A0AAD9FBT4_DISEL|nr:hypothetical protein KUDE01_008041 [Dissostichus eleginoides]